MRLYTLALFVASCMSLSLVVGKLFAKKEVSTPVSSMQEISYSQEIAESIVAAQKKAPPPEDPLPHLRVVAVSATPDSSTAAVTIQYPKEGALVRGNPVWVQIRVEAYPLANDSEFDRSYEIFDSKMGQTARIVIDNEPFFAINGPSIQPFNEDGFYYDQSYKFPVRIPLEEGLHTIRVYLARSFGESLKGERTFQASYFYVGDRGEATSAPLRRPYLTYNEPGEQSDYMVDKPILLDFYLTNCDLSPDGYKVRLSVDGGSSRILTTWQPYYLYGLPKGEHTIRLELIDAKNQLFSSPFNDNTRTIVVH